MDVIWKYSSAEQRILWRFQNPASRFEFFQNIDQFLKTADLLGETARLIRANLMAGMEPAAAIAEANRIIADRIIHGVPARRKVTPSRLPTFPRVAECPRCHKGGGTDPTVISYVDSGQPETSPRYIACGYCHYDGSAPGHPLYPKEGSSN